MTKDDELGQDATGLRLPGLLTAQATPTATPETRVEAHRASSTAFVGGDFSGAL